MPQFARDVAKLPGALETTLKTGDSKFDVDSANC
jgi:hypothetical protein